MLPLELADLRAALAHDLAGRYDVDAELLGSGGMAVVYGADDLRHGRRVAVKLLHPQQAAVFGADRFLREINVTAGLQHPHILPLLDSGAVGVRGSLVPYYVMPLVVGQSLRTRIDVEGALAMDESLRIARDVAEGLQYAHDRGVVHRDIKPENILLNASGAALVADFGVALATDLRDSVRLTEEGTSVGTPSYMSPEQLFGTADVDHRSDQYSLAATIYEMLAGRPPYDAPTRSALIRKRMTEPPDRIRKFLPDLPNAFEAALSRGLEREPDARHASVSELIASLERASGPESPASVAGRIGASTFMAAMAAVVALIAGGLWFSNRPVRSVSSGAMVVLADIENLTADPTLGRALQLAVVVGLQQSSSFALYPRARLGASLARMGRTIADTVLSEAIAREIASREAGHAVIVLTVGQVGGLYTVASRLVDPASGSYVAVNEVRAERASDLLTAVDEIVRWTRRRLGDANVDRTPALPLVTTSSLAALQAYAEANAALQRVDWGVAQRMLERAIELDTGFAMAQMLLGEFHVLNNRIPEGMKWLREAERRVGRLSEVEQLRVKSIIARAEGRTDYLVELAHRLATRFPSAANWHLYGQALWDADRNAEAIVALKNAVALDSTDAGSYYLLAMVHRSMMDYAAALAYFERADRADSTLMVTAYTNHFWGETFVLSDSLAAAEALFRRMVARPRAMDRARGYRSLAYLALYRGRFADAVGLLHKGIPLQTPGSLSEYRDVLLLADAELTRGRADAARAALDRAFDIFRTTDIQAAAVMFGGHQFVRAGQLARTRLLLDSLVARAALRPDSRQDQEALVLLTADVALASGRAGDARETLRSREFPEYPALGLSLRAGMFARLGRMDSALVSAQSAVERVTFGHEMQQDWLRSFTQLGRIAEQMDDTTAAMNAYSALIAQWRDGDPDLPPLQEARRALARLHYHRAR